MTQKEKLYREMMNIHNEIADLLEKNIPSRLRPNDYPVDIEHEIRVYRFRDYSVQELKDGIEWRTRRKEDLLSEIKLNKFYETEEGKKIKEDLEYQQKTLEDAIKELFNIYKSNFQASLNEICGNGYMITSFGNTSIEFAKEKDGKSIFGHSWSVYRDWGNKVTLNYGTLGSFDPLNDNDRVEYLMALANFGKPENFQKIVNLFEDFNKDIEKISKELRKIENLLRNPYEYAA